MCSQVFERHRPDVVFHLAAEARIQNCLNDPGRCMETNVMGTQTMLSLCGKHGVSRMVFMSTSAIYGLREPPNLEWDVPDCLNAYSYSKYFGEQLCKMYSTNYGLDTVCFRGFNIYGNRMPKKGQYALVMGIFQRLLREGKPLTITGDGYQSRDFIHVDDVCRALIAGAESAEKQNGTVYNIGTGTSVSIRKIAELMRDRWDSKEKFVFLPPRQGEARITQAGVRRIKDKLKWESKISVEDWIKNLDIN